MSAGGIPGAALPDAPAPDAPTLAYNPRPCAIDLEASFAHWQRESAATRSALPCRLDVRYGAHPMQTLDVFPAKGPPRALLMFIHGGYWRALDKADYALVARAVHGDDVTVVLPNYALLPSVTLEDVVRQMLEAAAWCWREAPALGVPRAQLHVAGHSAGGHLAAMLMAARFDGTDAAMPAQPFRTCVSISGLYDLRPIVDAAFLRDDLRLTDDVAARLSPALMPPAGTGAVHTLFGALEPSGFHDQDALLARAWAGVHRGAHRFDGHDHFTIVSALADPDTPASRLLRAAIDAPGG